MSHDVTDFQAEVLERSRTVPVVVDFWAAWCGPCRMLGPVIERLAEEANGRWVLAKVDTEAHPGVAERYGIASIPNVKLFVNGEIADEFVGALPEPAIRRWLEAAIPSPQAGEVDAAAALIERGAFADAATRLTAVIEREPQNRVARLLLGQALLHSTPERVAEALAPLADDDALHDRAEAMKHLAHVAVLAETPGALPEAPVRARFVDGARAVRAGDWDSALAAFVDVLREQRGYAEGAAKQAGRAIFLLLGIEHPACEKHYRAFASAVNV
jgi:putative thioredoxin